jgi:hypothetical protein
MSTTPRPWDKESARSHALGAWIIVRTGELIAKFDNWEDRDLAVDAVNAYEANQARIAQLEAENKKLREQLATEPCVWTHFQIRLKEADMTFIGIAIFTVYTVQMQWSGSCVPKWSTDVLCADIAKAWPKEIGRQEPVYVGEFPSLEACDAAVGAVTYTPKDGERVDLLSESLCVPKH